MPRVGGMMVAAVCWGQECAQRGKGRWCYLAAVVTRHQQQQQQCGVSNTGYWV